MALLQATESASSPLSRQFCDVWCVLFVKGIHLSSKNAHLLILWMPQVLCKRGPDVMRIAKCRHNYLPLRYLVAEYGPRA